MKLFSEGFDKSSVILEKDCADAGASKREALTGGDLTVLIEGGGV